MRHNDFKRDWFFCNGEQNSNFRPPLKGHRYSNKDLLMVVAVVVGGVLFEVLQLLFSILVVQIYFLINELDLKMWALKNSRSINIIVPLETCLCTIIHPLGPLFFEMCPQNLYYSWKRYVCGERFWNLDRVDIFLLFNTPFIRLKLSAFIIVTLPLYLTIV